MTDYTRKFVPAEFEEAPKRKTKRIILESDDEEDASMTPAEFEEAPKKRQRKKKPNLQEKEDALNEALDASRGYLAVSTDISVRGNKRWMREEILANLRDIAKAKGLGIRVMEHSAEFRPEDVEYAIVREYFSDEKTPQIDSPWPVFFSMARNDTLDRFKSTGKPVTLIKMTYEHWMWEEKGGNSTIYGLPVTSYPFSRYKGRYIEGGMSNKWIDSMWKAFGLGDQKDK